MGKKQDLLIAYTFESTDIYKGPSFYFLKKEV